MLRELGLKALDVLPFDDLTDYANRVFSKHFGKNSKGGESIHHKRLKDFILHNPERIGISDDITFCAAEFITLSQDRIDVLFKTKTTTYAVEVKSDISDDDDIVRGIFQAVKYQAVLEAQGKVNGDTNDIKSILVIGRTLPPMALTMAKILDVSVIENFNID